MGNQSSQKIESKLIEIDNEITSWITETNIITKHCPATGIVPSSNLTVFEESSCGDRVFF